MNMRKRMPNGQDEAEEAGALNPLHSSDSTTAMPSAAYIESQKRAR